MQRDAKKTIIKKFATHQGDTGSSQVQVAILTNRINELSEHLQLHPKDNHSRRGLIGLVAKRRKHLQYLKLNKTAIYESILQDLSLRK